MDFMHILGKKEAIWNTIFSIFERWRGPPNVVGPQENFPPPPSRRAWGPGHCLLDTAYSDPTCGCEQSADMSRYYSCGCGTSADLLVADADYPRTLNLWIRSPLSETRRPIATKLALWLQVFCSFDPLTSGFPSHPLQFAGQKNRHKFGVFKPHIIIVHL